MSSCVRSTDLVVMNRPSCIEVKGNEDWRCEVERIIIIFCLYSLYFINFSVLKYNLCGRIFLGISNCVIIQFQKGYDIVVIVLFNFLWFSNSIITFR